MFKTLNVLLALFCIINSVKIAVAETQVRKCANDALLPLRVQVNSCNQMPCDLWRGFATNMAIQFVSNKNALSAIKARVIMTTFGITMPFILTAERTDVCKNLMFDAYCPMDQNEDATYRLVLDIAEHQPEVPAKIEVSIEDESSDTILACFIVDARITKRNGRLIRK